MALVAVAGYYGARSYNPAFSEARRLEVTPGQEMALGLQAAPALAGRFGGLSADQGAQQRVDRVCEDLIGKTSVKDSPYDYDCHVLADEGTAQAFSLPGGQVFITTGLLRRLPGDGPLAGALSREIGHVVARHGVEHLATVRGAGERTGAEVLASYDPEDPASRRDPAVEALIGQVVTMRFSAEDEREADRLAARFLAEAGYDPRALDYSADAASNRSSGFPSARRR
ncbi:MAG: M48 family metalloprotease [Thermoanaerobaculia bacterium]